MFQFSLRFSPAQEFLILFASKNSPGDSQDLGSAGPVFGTLESGIVRFAGSRLAGQGQKCEYLIKSGNY